MAKTEPAPRPAPLNPPARLGVVASRYNAEFTDALVESARQEILAVDPSSVPEVVRVPGAFEIPVVVEALAKRGELDAILALGVIIRGSTAHADLIAASITDSLQEIAVRHCLPVIHEVLLVDEEEHARQRSTGTEMNRGTEAARTALEMATVFRNLKPAIPW